MNHTITMKLALRAKSFSYYESSMIDVQGMYVNAYYVCLA